MYLDFSEYSTFLKETKQLIKIDRGISLFDYIFNYVKLIGCIILIPFALLDIIKFGNKK